MVPGYTEIVSKRLPPEVFRPVLSRAFWLLAYVPVVAACTTAIVRLQLGFLSRLAFSLVIGVAFTCIGILAHEVLHGSVVEARWLRRVLGTVCLAPLNLGPVFWMMWHNTHHAHTQDPLRDPDNWGTTVDLPKEPGMRFLRRFTGPHSLIFPILLCTGVSGHGAALLFLTQRQMNRRQRIVTLIEFFLPLGFWVFLGLWLGWVHWVFFYLIPLLIANLIINSFVVTNHFLNPLDDGGDPLASSLTVTTYRWLERLLLNFNYHAEHHLLPGINPKYAPQVTRLLQELWPDRYQQMSHRKALLAVWRTPRVYFDQVSLIDLRDGTRYGTLGHGLNESKKSSK
ncbi:MAG TPA: fatty acid desaturase [Candidatus Angelobacter sp.]